MAAWCLVTTFPKEGHKQKYHWILPNKTITFKTWKSLIPTRRKSMINLAQMYLIKMIINPSILLHKAILTFLISMILASSCRGCLRARATYIRTTLEEHHKRWTISIRSWEYLQHSIKGPESRLRRSILLI